MHIYEKSHLTGKVSGIMANTIELKQQIAQGEYDAAFAKLYGADAVQEQRKRYTDLIDEFEKKYGTNRTVRLYSAPGRTEIGGNHTDHNNGVVLAGSVNLDMVAVVSPNEENVIRVKSLGFDKIDDVDVTNLVPQPREAEHSASLIRGVAKGIVDAGGKVGGFDCYTTSNVLRGSGLSSSAAFEVCIGAILRGEYNNNDMEKFNQVKIAQIGQYAENVFFGKPCGLMDQAAVCLGGLAYMDFEDQAQPKTQKLELNFEDHGYALVLVKVGADHVAATDDYAAVPREMQDVAAEFGKARLCEVNVADFDAKLPELRAKLGDRACLRAVHYWYENGLVDKRWAALNAGDIDQFLVLTRESGASSAMYLQNVVAKLGSEQPSMYALALAEHVLDGRGAVRIHGGGFGGTIQAFVPLDLVDTFIAKMNGWLGEGSARHYAISDKGAYAAWL
mgnify:CR=1 FL=1